MSAELLQSCPTLCDPMYVYVCMYVCMSMYVARQALLSMGRLRQESCSGLPFPPPGDLPNPGIACTSLASPALADGFFTTVSPGKPTMFVKCLLKEVLLAKIRSQERRQMWKDIYGKETIIPKSMIVWYSF